MPTYELSVLYRCMPREELAKCLKRTASAIFENGGFIRKIHNLGKMPTPHRIPGDDGMHREANYFVLEFEGAPHNLKTLNNTYERDVDILLPKIFRQEKPQPTPCTLDDELKPPAYRKEVQEMIEIGRRKKNKYRACDFRMNTGLDYYPFQR